MPDWKRLADERLAQSKLPPEIQREVVAEIAAHLEECYAALVRAGYADAEQQTLAQVPDWRAFARKIRRSKEDPMKFARSVVMPGVAAVILAQAALKLFVSLLITPGPCGPDMIPPGPGVVVDAVCVMVSADGPAYLPWLATLPLVGALAAWFARRMGARPAQRLLAAVAPALYNGVEFFLIGLGSGFFWRIPVYWVVIPALLCAIGAAPFLGLRRDHIEPQPLATAS